MTNLRFGAVPTVPEVIVAPATVRSLLKKVTKLLGVFDEPSSAE